MDRAAYETLRADSEASLAEANAWALRNHRPGESLMEARKRYAELLEPARRAALAAILNRAPTKKEDRVAVLHPVPAWADAPTLGAC